MCGLSDLTDGIAQGDQQQQPQQGPQGRRRVVPPPKLNNHDNEEISDDEMDELPLGGAHRGYSPRRSASGSGRVEMYFPAVDLEVRQRGSTPASDVSHASGRSTTALSVESTDGVDSGLEVEGEPLVRTASLSSTRTSTRVRRPLAHAPGVVITPSGRKSITAVSEVQWMMYWIVFALFTCIETFSDVLLSFWVPFYYEMKVVIVIWLLSPATKGSSLLYRKFVHPTLTEREREIDEYLAKMKERSYSTMLELGSKGINYALQTAIKQLTGGYATLPRSRKASKKKAQ
ncbi:hypothetical protein B566_EDAN004230 [Ephemera danica]|nr:hypothetical protein B566_EDAN004230 [Ephemera danica]